MLRNASAGDYFLSVDGICVAGCSLSEVLYLLNAAAARPGQRAIIQFRREYTPYKMPTTNTLKEGLGPSFLTLTRKLSSSADSSQRIRESGYYGVRWLDIPGKCQWLATLSLELGRAENDNTKNILDEGTDSSETSTFSSTISSSSVGGNNNYRILGLNSQSTQEEVKKAYYRLSLQLHPDKNPHRQEEAAVQFNRVAQAYKEIMNCAPSALTVVLGYFSSEKLAAQVCDSAARMQWGNAAVALLNFSARSI